MTLRFSRDFWTHRSSTTARPSRQELSAAIRRLISEAKAAQDRDTESGTCQSPDSQQITYAPLGGDCSLFLPDGYEPKYPYPLIVWFHRAGADEHELLDVMPKITTQNCIGLALRGPQQHDSGRGCDWPSWDAPLTGIEERLLSTVRSLRREYHVHSERIYPAGFGDGGTVALRLLFSRPEWFGGAAAFGFRIPSGKHRVLTRFRDLNGKRLLLGAGCRDRVAPAAGMLHLAHILQVAGMEIETRVFDAAHELTPDALTRINHWLMEGIYAANRVA